jgi:ligand-binding sensor domain-containing protein
MGNGLNKVDLKPKKFRLYQKKINNPFSLSENYIRAIEGDKEGNIWIGTLIGGLNRFDIKEEKFYHYKKESGNNYSSPNDNNVWSLCIGKDNFIWIGTNKGLNKYDPVTKKFSYYVHDEKDVLSLSENTVRAIFQDSKGNIWAGTEGGLNKFDRSTGKFKRYVKGSGSTSISDNTVWKILEDDNGYLWLATNDGLNRFDPYTGTFRVFRKDPANPKTISHNGIRTIFIDKKRNLWAGTQNGLNRYDEQTETFVRYDEANGLPNAFIYGILEDDGGNLWLSTNKGLCCFNYEVGHIRNFDIYDGLQDYEFNTNACYKSASGEMYFAGPGGLNRFHPEKLLFNKFSPAIEITAINILDKPLVSDTEIVELKHISLDYFENILSFEFSSLDFTFPSRNQYAYMMEGFNKDWVNCGNTRFTNYTNLDPGEYTFKVKGTNSDGIWNENYDSVKITIRHTASTSYA